jgi:hypothetical protein
MADGAVLGVHDGMIIEYDATTLAPLGMVVSKDELTGRQVSTARSTSTLSHAHLCLSQRATPHTRSQCRPSAGRSTRTLPM